MGSLEDMLYCLDCEPVMKQEHANPVNDDDMNIWHQHTSEQRLREMVCNDLAKGMIISQLSFCEGCVEGKLIRKPVGEIRSTRRQQVVHSDVCGPIATESIGTKRYSSRVLLQMFRSVFHEK